MFNPAIGSYNIKSEYVDYITTRYHFSDKEIQKALREELGKVTAKGPIVDVQDSFESTVTMRDLIRKGKLCEGFTALEAEKPKLYEPKIPLDRPLYAHQERAIEVINEGHNAVITTGTGSGKTECFLIPILDALLREKEEGTLDPGVRAILIYPMNALANDQIKRLREILMYYPDITFGVYHGDTKHKEHEADEHYRSLHESESYPELREPLPNELISRDRMKNTPPNILCTNYAMLEHLLLRPEDDVLFQNSNMRFIILDEAHVYYGATGMETAFLLRRLKARLHSRSQLQYILTSATLGKQNQAEERITQFAHNLTGETFHSGDVIFGLRKAQQFDHQTNIPLEVFAKIAQLKEVTASDVHSIFLSHAINYNDDQDVEANLYDLCYQSTAYQALRAYPDRLPTINNLAEKLRCTEQSVVELIHVCSQAHKEGKALIDVRYHFVLRALEGLYYAPSLNRLSLTRKDCFQENGQTHTAFELAVCGRCGAYAFVGKLSDSDEMGLKRLVHTKQYDSDTKFFQRIEQAQNSNEIEIEDDDIEDADTELEEEVAFPKENAEGKAIIDYWLCPQCGMICVKSDGKPRCQCEYISPIIVREYQGGGIKCPQCFGGKYFRLYLGNEAATAVLATSLFEGLPSVLKIDKSSPTKEEWDGGKQFLVFSDSRSEAAYFAPYMRRMYKEFLRRRALVQELNANKNEILNTKDGSYKVKYLVEALAARFFRDQTFTESLLPTQQPDVREARTIATRHAWIAVLNEMVNERENNGLIRLGYLQFRYLGNEMKVIDRLAKKYKNDREIVASLLDALVSTAIVSGAIEGGESTLKPEDKKYIFYTENQRALVEVKQKDTKAYYDGWCPRNREGKPDQVYPNKRLRLVMKSLHLGQAEAIAFLKDVWYYLKDPIYNQYPLQRGKGEYYYFSYDAFEVLSPMDDRAKWYRCDRCGHVSTFVLGVCTVSQCNGIPKEVSSEELHQNNHFAKLYNKDGKLRPLLIQEHTAQLSREEAQDYQQQFEKNEIHALSCSTTFEMGIDVGDLETVFLRNIPPTPANYTQRAGRAGRNKNAAAYALTFAKLSSHDFTFFDDPQLMIGGTIDPPVFRTDNEKILMRHIYSVVLSYFFKHSDYYNNNASQLFYQEGGLEALTAMLMQRPVELVSLLYASFGDALDKRFGISNFDWIDKLVGEEGVLTAMVREYEDTNRQFDDLIKKAKEQNEYWRVYPLSTRKKLFCDIKLIEALARYNVLPKYGFPVDTAELHLNNQLDIEQKKRVQLIRGLEIAIAEYAPGAKIIADDAMYTSRYIKKSLIHKENGVRTDFHTEYTCQCMSCKTWHHSKVYVDERKECKRCGLPLHNWTESIEPRDGFISDKLREAVPMKRPDRFFHSDATYVGDGRLLVEYKYSTSERSIHLTSSENDQIMLSSKNVFYVCKACGYSLGKYDLIYSRKNRQRVVDKEATKDLREGWKGRIETPESHENANGYNCSCKTLYRERLHHIFRTDVVQMDFDEQINFSDNDSTVFSVMYALLRAIATVLEVEQADISACFGYTPKVFSIVFYDTVAGGAGHVRRLLDQIVLRRVIQKAHQAMDHCQCDTSCYMCLRSYKNQNVHDQLDRTRARDYLVRYLGDCVDWHQEEEKQNNNDYPMPSSHNSSATQKTVFLTARQASNVGVYMESEPYERIWKQMLEEVRTEEEKQRIIQLSCADWSGREKPYFDGKLILVENTQEIPVILYWAKSKVALFFTGQEQELQILKQTDWNCFYTGINFEPKEMLQAIQEKV